MGQSGRVSDLAADPDPERAYMRVADDIAARISSGELAPGARLRAERELAEYYEVAYGTIRHAVKVLPRARPRPHSARPRELHHLEGQLLGQVVELVPAHTVPGGQR